MGGQRRIILGAVLCIAGGIVSPSIHAQSFDCKKASTVIEKAICNDESAGEFDQQLADTVKKLLATHPDWTDKFMLAERHWLQYRDAQCVAFAGDAGKMDDCLRDQYAKRIAIVESSDPLADPVLELSDMTDLARDYRERIRASLPALPFLNQAAIAGSNVPTGSAPVDEIFDQCAPLDEGMLQRLPEYTALKAMYTKLVAELTTDPAYRESAEQLQFTQCSWLRAVAMRCLEPMNPTKMTACASSSRLAAPI